MALAWANVASARVTANACNGCTDAQYEAMASSIAQNARSIRTQYVYDLTNAKLKAYQITREPVYGGYTYYADEIDPAPATLQAFQVYEQALADNNYRPTVFATRNQTDSGFPDPTVSTLGVAAIGAYQYDIGAWVVSGNYTPIATDAALTAAGLADALASIVLKQNLLVVNVTVNMIDGGILTFVYDGTQKNAQITEARDANHNRIPLTVGQVPGTYIFKNGTGDKFAGFIHTYYPDVGFDNYQVCKNGTLACTKSAAGSSCEWFSCGGVP
ncbi:MAG: hypothetical protein ACREPN_04745 [Rudaea sp.]